MQYQRKDKQILVRLDKGDRIMENLLDIAKKESIHTASVTGLGAADIVNIAFFETDTKDYRQQQFNEPFEILNLTGFLTHKDNEPHAHLHITLGREDFSVIGGHLMEAQINITCEIVLNIIDIPIDRQHNEEIGIDIFGFTPNMKKPSFT
ncbi:PPC domain-containing DNA-binding protein [Fundicoccus culcitae]|uniref:DNA-binding protein n=1 Tax=Fundicoccus culcitae TaxID=2969821 RepID=A0ABY5P7I4_9LACT|nr:PPC domain-containing DNA-binding protein [Fundicoccus culcitae]UUX34687.1 DNA-binding protein [Fundicoccus culcitae]